LINHSPRPRTDAPNHDDMKTPTKKMKVMEVMNPRPDQILTNNINKFQTIKSIEKGFAAQLNNPTHSRAKK